MRPRTTIAISRPSRKTHGLLLSLTLAGLATQPSAARGEDPKQLPIVQEVHIDNNSTPPLVADPAQVGGGGGAADECEQYKQKIAELNNQFGVNRNALATALATIKLKVDATKPIILTDNDEFEVLSVRFLEGEDNGILQWTPLDEWIKKDSEPSSGSPSPATTTPAASAAGGGGLQNNTVPTSDVTPPVEQRVIIKEKDITIESISPRGSKQFRMRRGQDGTIESVSGGGTATPFQRLEVNASNIQHLTYQQPTAPWKVIYEQEGDTLRQWVRYSNYTYYSWNKGTKITLSDLFLAKDNRKLELHTKSKIPGRSSALQLLRTFPIKSESYNVELRDQNALATKKLTLAFSGYMPDGEFRDTVQPTFAERSAAITEKAENEVLLETEPSLLAIKKSWDLTSAQTVVGLEGAKFKIYSERTTRFVLRNSGGVRSVEVSKPRSLGWKAVDSTWIVDGDYYVQSFQLEGPEKAVELVESNTAVYNFETPEGYQELAKVVGNWEVEPVGLGKVLQNCLEWQGSLSRNAKALEKVSQEIDELSARYENYEIGHDLSRDSDIRLVARGMWERLNSLKRTASTLTSTTADLQVKLHESLYPASSH